ncbi:MAG: metal-dependent hydrolase, partial [Gammaproteobacteria bacterium]
MDPFTQGIVGVTASQSISKKKHLLIASAIGLLAGIAPDIDIFIKSDKDPLLFLEYHRHFTHSLFFIPLGSLICAFVFYHLFVKYYNLSFRYTYIYSFIEYA